MNFSTMSCSTKPVKNLEKQLKLLRQLNSYLRSSHKISNISNFIKSYMVLTEGKLVSRLELNVSLKLPEFMNLPALKTAVSLEKSLLNLPSPTSKRT